MNRTLASLLAVLLSLPILPKPARGEDLGTIGPDLISADITSVRRWGQVDDITAFSFGIVACNAGDDVISWMATTSSHPVSGQNLYRLKNGRFEQVGQSWLLHGFFALQGSFCFTDCVPTAGTTLGVHCSTSNSSGITGSHAVLGPRHEVDPAQGVFLFPFSEPPVDATIGRRLQVHDADLDPTLNPSASYFAEIHFVSEDDSSAGNQDNNAAWREATVTGTAPTFDLQLTGATVEKQSAIFAWKVADPDVLLSTVKVSGDGRFILGSKATSLGGDRWAYEYALYNMNSHRSAGSFSVPTLSSSSVTQIGFHDVDYHSGEPFDDTDWPGIMANGSVFWETETFATDPDANALRWGTLYNFRFESDAPPVSGAATIGLFRPGAPDHISMGATVPMNKLSGNVNSVTGEVADVLLVNGTTGSSSRTVDLGQNTPLKISVDSPPSKSVGTARFVVYAWAMDPDSGPGKNQPLGIGATALPTPLNAGCPGQPIRAANGLAHEFLLGPHNWPTSVPGPAPFCILDLTQGAGRPARFYVQGLIQDCRSPHGQLAVTNGVLVVID